MEVVKVCRICLVMDVNMYNMQTQSLETYFEPIIGTSLSAMELPPFACFECAALVKKYYHFRDRCLRGQAILYGILHTNGKITKHEIQQINRSAYQLNSNFTVREITEDHVIYHTYDEDSTYDVKTEPSIENGGYKFNMEDDVNEEGCFEDLPLLLSTDDDEPLSLHKNNKEKKAKKKEKKKSKREKKKKLDVKLDNIESFEDIDATDYLTEIATELLEIVPQKQKRGRPRKSKVEPNRMKQKPRRTTNTGGVLVDDIDLEEYVTVVKLSIEDQMEEINKRQQSSNYLNAPYQCNLCYKGFIDTHAWKHHLSKHDPSAGSMECPICKIRFKSKYVLNRHATNHERKYICKSCSYVSTSTVQAKRHERWHKGVIYNCQYCGEVLTKWTSYLSHVRIKHPSEFICGVCGYSFFSKLGLAMHKTRMHKDVTEMKEADNNIEADLYCKECDVKFISAEAFQRHMVTSVKHTNTNNVSNGCRECGETFKSPEELTNHRKLHARKVPKHYGKKSTDMTWPAKCQHCSEEISNGRAYWNHFRRAHPDKDYPVKKNHICDICGKSFKSNTFLVYHKRTHSEERAYKCSTCGKAFHNNGNLQLHHKTHSDARPYPCTVCLKAFKCKGALSKHYRRHKGEKPYECQICGKAFTESSGRKLHIRTVHLKQPAPRRDRLQRKKTS